MLINHRVGYSALHNLWCTHSRYSQSNLEVPLKPNWNSSINVQIHYFIYLSSNYSFKILLDFLLYRKKEWLVIRVWVNIKKRIIIVYHADSHTAEWLTDVIFWTHQWTAKEYILRQCLWLNLWNGSPYEYQVLYFNFVFMIHQFLLNVIMPSRSDSQTTNTIFYWNR